MKTALKNYSRKGFTLIELLIVIAILAVMALAVLAAIDPAAKIKSAKDSNVKSDLPQIVNALQAYFTGGTQTYPANLAALTPTELKSLPKQQASNGGCITVAGADATDYCYTTPSGVAVAVWGTLFSPVARSFYCWDSTTGAYKTSLSGVITQTTCP